MPIAGCCASVWSHRQLPRPEGSTVLVKRRSRPLRCAPRASAQKPAGFAPSSQPSAPAGQLCTPLTDAPTKALLTWASSLGIRCPDLQPGLSGDLRGLCAVRPFPAGSVVATLPRRAVLEVTTLASSPPQGLTAPAAYIDAPWWARMALLLLRERNLGAASTCAQYIASLPQRALATPHRWSDSQLTALRDAAIIARIKSQQKDIAAQWHTLCATAPSNCIAASFTAADFSWAVDMVRSRTFSGPYEGSDWSDRVRLVVLLLALTAAYVLTGAGPLENGLSGLLAGGAFILLKDAATQALPNAPRRYIMAPVLDLCNHRPGVVSDLTYQYFANCFELILGSGAQQPGEEVFVSYGAHSAEELLQLYGFVDCGVPNVDDVITLTADDVDNAPADAADAACRQTLAQACPLTITRSGEVVPALEARTPLTQAHSRAIAAILGAKYTAQQAAADAEVVRVAKARRSAFANDELDADAALLAAQFCVAKNETAREAILALTAAR